MIAVDLRALNYEARLEALLAHGIGLGCHFRGERKGRLDTAIRQLAPNSLVELIETLTRSLLRKSCKPGANSDFLAVPCRCGTAFSQAAPAPPDAGNTSVWAVIKPNAGHRCLRAEGNR